MSIKEKLLVTLVAGATVATGVLVSLEGYEPKPYKDIANITTDCFGNTKNVRMDHIRSYQECQDLLREEVYRIGEMLLKDFPDHTESTLASGISFVYNIGDGAYRSSTYRKKLKQYDFYGACTEMYKWVYITKGGVKVKSKGLENRRNKEVELCLQYQQEYKPQVLK